ncbi:hypothetical protein EST38_g481 [Candolleomyces aberdarensis]|uniref:YTH domain-containing protein n=1 Tax=Candolleomyces aberdarensis TaxID=2316362 RepID=A0A4Q2E0X8_9AGAR|nr:hypothetical protein EST38_g481 [Candolleomyces aberdarensis]
MGNVDPSDPISPQEVVSIFLIARSNCAFINYASQSSLEAALKVFNGQRLRPNDPQCPMLVCKVRRSADDLKSGVGGQRGIGLHRQWVKEQRKLQSQRQGMVDSVSDDASVSSQSALDHLPDGSMSLSTRDPELRSRRTQESSSSGSYASTTSSFLGEHFPTRYFILKSLSENDLELSVQSGLWATQKHNELILDRAFRTATDVFLIFSVNKSGEFYGYARMAGPIQQGEGSVSWSSLSGSPTTSHLPLLSKTDTRLLSGGQPIYLSPDRIGDLTTQSIGSSMAASIFQPPQHMSAPANLGGQQDTPPHADKQSFRLDPEAPLRAMKEHSADGARGERGAKGKPSLGSVKEGGEDGIDGIDGAEDGPMKPSPLWGDCFKVEWMERKKIPFHRTRHLRNAWNKGREIKVSRDGTELESSVGQRLLEEWGSLAESS